MSDIVQGPDGLVYVAIEGTYPTFSNPDRIGGGILVIDIDDTENISVIDTTILSYYTSSSSSRHYIVVQDLEFDQFSNGTKVVAEAIADSTAYSIAGGGDTRAAIDNYDIGEKIS